MVLGVVKKWKVLMSKPCSKIFKRGPWCNRSIRDCDSLGEGAEPFGPNLWDYLVKGAVFPLVVVFPETSRVNVSHFLGELVKWYNS